MMKKGAGERLEFVTTAPIYDVMMVMREWGYTKPPNPGGNDKQWFAGWTSSDGKVFGVWDDTPEGAVRASAVMAIQDEVARRGQTVDIS